jgi:hypothetical protein
VIVTGDATTVSVTGTEIGVTPEGVVAATVTLPWYVPGARLVAPPAPPDSPTFSVAGDPGEADAGATLAVSHAVPPVDADNPLTEPPVALINTGITDGAGKVPCTMLNTATAPDGVVVRTGGAPLATL